MCDHVHDWLRGTPRGQWVSMGVVSNGAYGVAKDVVYSFPVKCSSGKWKVRLYTLPNYAKRACRKPV